MPRHISFRQKVLIFVLFEFQRREVWKPSIIVNRKYKNFCTINELICDASEKKKKKIGVEKSSLG